MAVETQVFPLPTGPVNLAFNLRETFGNVALFIQNVGTSRVYFAERAEAPQIGQDGIIIPPGGALTIAPNYTSGEDALGAWVWVRSTGKVAVGRAGALG